MSAQVARARLGGKKSAEDQESQRVALLRRVAVAGGLIAMLIGGLALFDASRTPAEPVPVASVQPEETVVGVEPPAEGTALPTLPAIEQPPVEAAAVNLPETPPPLPEGTARSENNPVEAAVPDAPVPTPAAVAPSRPPSPAPQRAVASAPGRLVIGNEAPTRNPVVPAISRAAPPGEGEIQGYRVQVGVFNSVENAEQVRARLAIKGIPSQIEARVHVGPFKSRAEADQVRTRLRTIGLDSASPVPFRAPVRP